MMFLCDNGNFQSFRRVRGWALEHAVSIDCAVGDLRWAMIALVLRSVGSVWVLGRRQFGQLVRTGASRPAQAADSMVAAGRG